MHLDQGFVTKRLTYMALKRILRIDDPVDLKVLNTVSRPVKFPNRELKSLVNEMFAAMRNGCGVGLAAIQVGVPLQIIVIEMPPTYEKLADGTEKEVEPAVPYVFINPKIVQISRDEVMRLEGCLSLPNWYGQVPRAKWLTVEYQDLSGKPRRLRKADDLLGWALQHEIDHLKGIVFTERLPDPTTLRDYSNEPLPNAAERMEAVGA